MPKLRVSFLTALSRSFAPRRTTVTAAVAGQARTSAQATWYRSVSRPTAQLRSPGILSIRRPRTYQGRDIACLVLRVVLHLPRSPPKSEGLAMRDSGYRRVVPALLLGPASSEVSDE